MPNSLALRPVLNKMLARTCLTQPEREAFLSLAGSVENVSAHSDFVECGSEQISTCFVVRGLCARMAQTRNGARQITNFYVVGDTPDLQSLLIPKPAFALQALTDCVILRIPHPHIRALSHSFPALMEAFWRETVRDADIVAQWVVNVGCRDAKTRLCHLFCEMAVRSGKEEGNTFEYDFPVTQIQLADATGLSTVHTNRSLQQIRRDRVVEFREGKVVVHDWTALREMADFDIGYLAVAAPIRFSN